MSDRPPKGTKPEARMKTVRRRLWPCVGAAASPTQDIDSAPPVFPCWLYLRMPRPAPSTIPVSWQWFESRPDRSIMDLAEAWCGPSDEDQFETVKIPLPTLNLAGEPLTDPLDGIT